MTTMKESTTCGRREMRALLNREPINSPLAGPNNLNRAERRALAYGRRDAVAKLARAKMLDAFKAKMLASAKR